MFLYQRIGIAAGHVPLKAQDFYELMKPMIGKLQRSTARGERPGSRELAGQIYDALSDESVR